jgi:hypothetical protein
MVRKNARPVRLSVCCEHSSTVSTWGESGGNADGRKPKPRQARRTSYRAIAIHKAGITHGRTRLSLFLPVEVIIRTISFRVTDETHRRLRQWSRHHAVPWSRAIRYILETGNWDTDPKARQKRSVRDMDYISPMARFARIIRGGKKAVGGQQSAISTVGNNLCNPSTNLVQHP